MCSISMAATREKLIELIKLNEYRGTHSHSLTLFNERCEIDSMHRGLGPIDIEQLEEIPKHFFALAHQQAPTTENKNEQAIHPAQIGNDHFLWHNGIIKQKEILRLQKKLECTSTWDTKLILRQMVDFGTPENIDGTFACVYAQWYAGPSIFRNEISPLYWSHEGVSSTKFNGSEMVPANKIYSIQYTEYYGFEFFENETFTTVENPYFFGE